MAYSRTQREMHVLVIADNAAERTLISDAFASAREALIHVSGTEGGEIEDSLSAHGNTAHAPQPDLILLSMGLQEDAAGILSRIKRSPVLRPIPLVVLAHSDQEERIRAVYEGHANCCIVRSADTDQFLNTLAAVREFWLRVAKRPNMRYAGACA